MVKFKSLILSVLDEGESAVAEPIPGEDTKDTTEEETPPTLSGGKTKSLRDWFFNPQSNTSTTTDPSSGTNVSASAPTNLTKEIIDLESTYIQAYGPGTFPSVDDLSKILNIWRRCWSRTSASQFFEYAQYMPFIEFMAQVAHLAGDVSGVDERFLRAPITEAAFKASVATFITALKNKPTANPIDFPVSTAEGQYVATQIKKHIQTNYVGQITLDKYPGSSIKDAIFYILEARKKARLATLPQASVPDQGKEVLRVLLRPKDFAGGTYAFSNKVSSDKIYTRAIHTELLAIGLSARRFFDAECLRLFKKDPTTGKFKEPGPDMSDTAYEIFLNNGSVDGQNFFVFSDNDGDSVPAKDIGSGGYIVSNIKIASQKNEAAKDLYEKLTELANYVREGEIIDWLAVIGGAAKAAGALSFGAPTVGGKR